MAPPSLACPKSTSDGAPIVPSSPGEMSLAWINRLLPRYFEMGTVYTMIAGLLNILAVYDACCGPVPAEPVKNEEEEKPGRTQDAGDEEKKS